MKKNIVILSILTTLLLMLFPFPVVPDRYHIDKFTHITIFTTLTLIIFLAVDFYIKNNPMKAKILTLLTLLCFSTSVEYLQIFIPHRGFSYYDLLANWSGLLLGMTIFFTYKKIKTLDK